MNQTIQPECNICLNEFESQVYIPKILQCGHTLCVVCLQKMCKDQKITCHKCLQTFQQNPEQAITNFGLLEILQSKNEVKQKNSACSEHELPKKFFCFSHSILICHGCILGDHPPEKCEVKDLRNSYEKLIPKYSQLQESVSLQQQKLSAFQQQNEQQKDLQTQIEDYKTTVVKQTEQMIDILKQVQQDFIQKADALLQNEANPQMQNIEAIKNAEKDFQEIQKEQENDQNKDLSQILERIKKLEIISKQFEEFQLSKQQNQVEKKIVAKVFTQEFIEQLKNQCDIQLIENKKQNQENQNQEEEIKQQEEVKINMPQQNVQKTQIDKEQKQTKN